MMSDMRKEKLSALTLFIFGILLITSGCFADERYSILFVTFGIISIILGIAYWILAEKKIVNPTKTSLEQSSLPNYEQSVLPHIEIPPTYDEAIKLKSVEI